jgi:LysR family transcriptional regulator, low CO2-responsive transcriptional regulator
MLLPLQLLGAVVTPLKVTVRLLEEELKVRLFVPAGRGIKLTEQGLFLLGEVQAHLTPLETLKGRFSDIPQTAKAEPLAIGGSHGSSALFLPKLLTIFRKTHPQVAVTLRTNQTRVLEQLILNSHLELAVVSRRPHSLHLAAEPYREENFVAFTLPNHPLSGKLVISVSELLRSPLVIRGGGGKRNRGTTENLLNELDPAMRPNIVMRAESPVALKAAVQNGMGVGILLEDLVYADVKDGRFKALRLVFAANLKSTSFLIYHRERPLSSHAQDFLALLRAWRRNASSNSSGIALPLRSLVKGEVQSLILNVKVPHSL